MNNNCKNKGNCTNNYNCNSCNNYCPEVINVSSCAGPIGDTGPQGPTGPQGNQGEPGLPLTSNFSSLQLMSGPITYANGAGYIPVEYTSIVENVEQETIIPPSIPGNGDVVLTANHTYFIIFNTHASVPTTGSYVLYRVVLDNGAQIIPDAGDAVEWGNDSKNICHMWTYRPAVDTTLRYELSAVNIAYTLRGAFLNIVQLN